jgi:adenylosuccinate synthase
MEPELASEVRELGQEYGTVTGRDRRPGWLDLVALRYAVRLNGITSLAVTKLDVLSAFDELRVCVRYRLPDGTETRDFPAHQSDFHHAEPVFEAAPGWGEPLDGCSSLADLPGPASDYVELIERELGVPVQLVGTGAAREQVLARAR